MIQNPSDSRSHRAPRPLRVGLTVAPLLSICLVACAPELPPPKPDPAADATEVGTATPLELDPAAPLDAAPPVLRFRVRLEVAAEDVDLARVRVFRGKLGPAHLRQISRDEISNALSKRVVPALTWIDETAPGEPRLIAAPTEALAAGETYTVAGGDPAFSYAVQIASDAEPPLVRVWPPPEGGATVALGVWCGSQPLPDVEIEAELSPTGPQGALRRGAVGDIGARCVRFEATSGPSARAADDAPSVGPPAFGGRPTPASLDPRPFVLDAPPPISAEAVCAAGEARFGSGCVEVADDRLVVRSGSEPLLWAVAGDGVDDVWAARPGESFTVSPLPPSTAIALAVATIDTAGRIERSTFSARTLAPMAHMIISEVLANPLGPEPGQEWVELYNDGSASADLSGYVLADVGGEASLPAVSLDPGRFALVVSEDFIAEDELDPSPAPEALLLRVAKLGNHGLSNAGEPLQLKDGLGRVVSRSPASPAPRAGMSLARTTPRAPDGVAGSFMTTWPTPGRENIIHQEIP